MTAGPPRAPVTLGPAGRALWRSLVSGFEFEPAELAVVRSACELEDRAAGCAVVLAVDGLVTVDRYGSPRPHPLLAEERNARLAVGRLLRQLGLAPVAVGGRAARPGPKVRARARAERFKVVGG